jgi:hypothetical protein
MPAGLDVDLRRFPPYRPPPVILLGGVNPVRTAVRWLARWLDYQRPWLSPAG